MKRVQIVLICLLWLGLFLSCQNPTSSPAPTYTITYNANGTVLSGTVPTDSTNYLQGATVTVQGNNGTLVRTGYSFAGWNTNLDFHGQPFT